MPLFRMLARVALISMFLAIHFATISLAAPQNPQPPTQLPIPCLTVMQGDWDGDGLDNLTECQLGTNQMNADSDGDSFNDFDELEYGTDPLNPNSDGDSLTDGCEYQWVMSIDVALDPLVFDVDSDTDEIPDALENWFGLDAGSMDTDQDMLWDREEWKPCPKFAKGCSVSCAMNPDIDGDGLVDGVEVKSLGTSQYLADTDGDGFEDGDEVYLYDTDPTDPRDHPQSDEYPRNHP